MAAAGQPGAVAALYELCSDGLPYLPDPHHEELLGALRRGELRDPVRVIEAFRQSVHGQLSLLCRTLDPASQNEAPAPPQPAGRPGDRNRQGVSPLRVDAMRRLLLGIASRDREALLRYYLFEESAEAVCADLNLSETQFRRLRSRVRRRFRELLSRKGVNIVSRRQGAGVTPRSAQRGSGGGLSIRSREIGGLVPVITHAVAVFGDEFKAAHWLETPLPIFGNRAPRQVLEEAGGIALIEQTLTRIEHNIPS